MTDAPYTAAIFARATSNGELPFCYGLSGPGNGLGYYARHGNPQNTFATMEEAEKAARLMNLAFREGQAERARAIKALLV